MQAAALGFWLIALSLQLIPNPCSFLCAWCRSSPETIWTAARSISRTRLQVPVLTGQRPIIVRFRPAARNARLLRPASAGSSGCAWDLFLVQADFDAVLSPDAVPERWLISLLSLQRCRSCCAHCCGSLSMYTHELHRHGSAADAAHVPSARLWLGNISNQANAPSVRAAFEPFGPVVDAAAFPARIGPLGYAIVVFERVGASIAVHASLTAIPTDTWC